MYNIAQFREDYSAISIQPLRHHVTSDAWYALCLDKIDGVSEVMSGCFQCIKRSVTGNSQRHCL